MATIKKLFAEQAFDSKGYPTLRGVCQLSDGQEIYSMVANNLHGSKYSGEFLYDGGTAFDGRGVTRSIKYVNELLAPKLTNVDPMRYKDIDLWLLKADPSENKEVLGVNTTLLISQLVYKAASFAQGIPFYRFLNSVYKQHFDKTIELRKIPSPIISMITGGVHGASTLSFQDFFVLPSTGMPFTKAFNTSVELYHELKSVFNYRNIFSGVGDDGGYVPNLSSNVDALEIIKEAILKRDLKIGLDMYLGVDLAADFFFKGGKYVVGTETFDTKGFAEYLARLFKEYRVLLVEDPFGSDDTLGWQTIMTELGERVYIVGDDTLATNKHRLEKVVKDKMCNMANVKLTERGTLWETMEFIAGARKSGLKIIVSQSAIETNDECLADFAVGVQADFVKFGAPVRGERIGKYNRLLTLEKEIQNG